MMSSITSTLNPNTMRLRSLLTLLIAGCALLSPCLPTATAAEKKVHTHMPGPKKHKPKKPKKAKKKKKGSSLPAPGVAITLPGLVVVSRADTAHPLLCDALCQIGFSGYDKRPSATKESIFVTNSMPRHLKKVKVRLTYSDPKGRKLHSRDVMLECDVPPGQTRNVSFTTWDKQGRFYYCGGAAPRSGGASPYDITLEPVEFYFLP